MIMREKTGLATELYSVVKKDTEFNLWPLLAQSIYTKADTD